MRKNLYEYIFQAQCVKIYMTSVKCLFNFSLVNRKHLVGNISHYSLFTLLNGKKNGTDFTKRNKKKQTIYHYEN